MVDADVFNEVPLFALLDAEERQVLVARCVDTQVAGEHEDAGRDEGHDGLPVVEPSASGPALAPGDAVPDLAQDESGDEPQHQE